MKNKLIAFFGVVIFLFTSLSLPHLLIINAAASESLGSISECSVDNTGKTVTVSGSIKHSVMINNRDAKIALYRFDPWVNVYATVEKVRPISVTDMSLTFEFEIPCSTIIQKCSLYAVALITSDGGISLISNPQYVNIVTSDTSDAGFKGILTQDTAAALASCAGSAVVDVYLDKLDNGNQSGYIYNADGQLLYFDRETVNKLDKDIRSYTASGCDVYLRFLISPTANNLPFCSKGSVWATWKSVTVNDRSALNALYSYTYFLVSRYSGASYGKVNGIILGSGADMPILYNYAVPVSESYGTMYARSLTLIGLAASDVAPDSGIALIVPVGDSLDGSGKVYSESFLNGVAEYIEKFSDLTFTVMCESRHNPYKITDSMFVHAETPGDPFEIDSDVTEPLDETVYDDPVTDEMTDSETTFDENTEYTDETQKPTVNTSADGYFCTDNIDVFLKMLQTLKKTYTSVNDGFGWCWYPGDDTVEGALGVCYAYNYMKLATVEADFYVVGFADAVSDNLSGISHLLKYIDTENNVKETAYARSVFEISNWNEIIDGYGDRVGIFNVLHEGEMSPNVADFTGSLIYLDYSSSKSTGGWFEGIYCNSLGIGVENGVGVLQADFDLESAGVNQAEIGYMLSSPEPLLLGEALTFEIKCGEDDGALYEVAVYINCGNETIISKTVVAGGVKCAFSADVGAFDDEVAVDSIRISLKRVTGKGDCKFNLYRIILHSDSSSDADLSDQYLNLRQHMRSEIQKEEKNNVSAMVFCAILLSAFGVAVLLFAYSNDKKLKEELNENDNPNNYKRGKKE